MLTAEMDGDGDMGRNEENTEVIKDQLAVTMAFPDNSQREEENVTLETLEATLEATEVLSSCQDTCEAAEEQFLEGVPNPEAYLESEEYEGEMETVLSVQKNTAERALVYSSAGERWESLVETVLPVPAQVNVYAEEVTSVPGGGPVSFSEAGEETKEKAVLCETSVSETADDLETDPKACDTGAWATNPGAPSESSEPGEAALSASSNLNCNTFL